jgi:penicillin-binding protein 1A
MQDNLLFTLGAVISKSKRWTLTSLSKIASVVQRSRLTRWSAYSFGLITLFFAGFWIALSWDLPDAERLIGYETDLPTVVRGFDGEIVHTFARNRRIQLQYDDFPNQLIEAYISAEDKTFFDHGGVDVTGTVGAMIDYIRKYGTSERAVGGSTITQQVAKNLLLSDEYSIVRKLREMILASRIENVLNKEEILEIYLNEIPLGRRSFGVQAASQAYFNKDVEDLELEEAAFLAILPKAPERYSRQRNSLLAIERRNFVLEQMMDNGFITSDEMRLAQEKPLGIVSERSSSSVNAGYFLEEVRRQLLANFGETKDDGPDSVYAGGLWVRTSLEPNLQDAAREALRAGLLRYHGGRGWAGPIARIDVQEGNWASQLASSFLGISHEEWRVGVITDRMGNSAQVGFANGDEAPLLAPLYRSSIGDVVTVKPISGGYRLAIIPEVSGGFLVQSVQTGRVLAMQGGFDFRLSDFNRATQAKRQPGSTIKPFVYATGLDFGMTPASEVPDQAFCYYQGSELGEKCFRNFSGEEGGIHTLRWGLEQSRNLMTVHIAMDVGMERVNNTFEKLDIGSYEPYPAFALGAGDTTVLKLVNAYAALANHGRLNSASVIDYVQNRSGKVIWRSDNRFCEGCNLPRWDGGPMPRLEPKGIQAINPQTAFQTIHMLEGVVERGTGRRLRNLGLPMFGKTGTTSGPTNAWFVGGTPEVVAGVYIGHDQPRNLGSWVQGGNTAAPIVRNFFQRTISRWSKRPAFAAPGINMIRIDLASGKRIFGNLVEASEGQRKLDQEGPDAEQGITSIWEAFKPNTAPPRVTRQDRIADLREELIDLIRKGTDDSSGSSMSEIVVEEPGF